MDWLYSSKQQKLTLFEVITNENPTVMGQYTPIFHFQQRHQWLIMTVLIQILRSGPDLDSLSTSRSPIGSLSTNIQSKMKLNLPASNIIQALDLAQRIGNIEKKQKHRNNILPA